MFSSKLLKRLSFTALFVVMIVLLFSVCIPFAAKHMFGGAAIEQNIRASMLLSDQPDTLSLSKHDKIVLRLSQTDTYLDIAVSSILKLPVVLANYLVDTHESTMPIDGFSAVFVDFLKTDEAHIMASLNDLGVSWVGVRIYTDENDTAIAKNRAALRDLKKAGYHVFVVIAQKPGFTQEQLTLFSQKLFNGQNGTIDALQIGEAINRSKWGVFGKTQYLQLINAVYPVAVNALQNVKIVAPPVIDFEWFYAMYYASLAPQKHDILGSLLYVDRVGQPENEQYGFDTAKKMNFIAAIEPEKPLWITEVNWPIAQTGEYKPTSNAEAVSETQYEAYMLRYLATALGTQHVQRVFWWQLYAKGYGLIDHTNDQKRAAYDAFKFFTHITHSARLRRFSFDGWIYKTDFINNEGKHVSILWSKDDKQLVWRKTAGKTYYNSEGIEIENPVVGGMPIYEIGE